VGLLSKASRWLNSVFDEQESRRVLYFRKDTGLLLPVNATVGRADRQIQMGIPEAHRETATRDFIILTSWLVEGGKPFLPSAGDEVIETQDGQTYTWEVYHDPLDGPFRWHDEEEFRAIRVHTLSVSVDDGAIGSDL
jgi:hypothetical protein